MDRRWGLAFVVALFASACSAEGERVEERPADTTVTSAPGEVAGAASPTPAGEPVAEVVWRGPLAEIGGTTFGCADESWVGCPESVVVHGLDWAAVPVEGIDLPWGRVSATPVAIRGTMHADGSIVATAVEAHMTPRALDLSACAVGASGATYPTVGPGALTVDEANQAIIGYTVTIGQDLAGELDIGLGAGRRVVPVHTNAELHQRELDAVAPGRACVVEAEFSRNELGAVRDRVNAAGDEERGEGNRPSARLSTSANRVVVRGGPIDERFRAEFGDVEDLMHLEVTLEVLGPDASVVDDALAVREAARSVRSEAADVLARSVPTCRSFPVDLERLDGPPTDHLDGHPSVVVFTEVTPLGDVIGLDGPGWRRVFERPDIALYVEDQSGRSLVATAWPGDVWVWGGGGSCGSWEIVDPLGYRIAHWELDERPPAAATTFAITVNWWCQPDPPPSILVEETDESVTVTVVVVPYEPEPGCTEFDTTTVDVSLAAPLGDRILLDGETLPPVEVA